MSSNQARDPWADALPQLISGDRRSKVRFPLDLPVRYQTLGRSASAGKGWVVNMSSGGLLVAYQQEVPVGSRMELNIEWPSMLDGRIPLQLVTLGRVVRCETSTFAVALARPQFRTVSRAGRSGVIPIDFAKKTAKA